MIWLPESWEENAEAAEKDGWRAVGGGKLVTSITSMRLTPQGTPQFTYPAVAISMANHKPHWAIPLSTFLKCGLAATLGNTAQKSHRQCVEESRMAPKPN